MSRILELIDLHDNYMKRLGTLRNLVVLRDALLGKTPSPSTMGANYDGDDTRDHFIPKNSWILDSDVIHHVASNSVPLLDFTPYSTFEGITLGSGDTFFISNIGKTNVHALEKFNFSLNDVFHIPSDALNLIYFNKLYNDFSAEFEPYAFGVNDVHSKQIKLQDPNHNGLYKLKDLSSLDLASNLTVTFLASLEQ